ncbi:hypothetical protein OH77DRAFT_621716 [Trametes cingulata]|nr:hypothetical protein OH77DRAFT_621716 [Trametes cingulata]
MTSLRKYAARRHHASFYSVDPTIPTGTPVEGPIVGSTSQLRTSPETGTERSATIEEQIHDPMGLVEDIAREYARIRSELGPKPSTAAQTLDERALRRKRRKEQAEQHRRELAIFVDQYSKLITHAAYVDSVWKHMEESGYFDEAEDEEEDDDEGFTGGREGRMADVTNGTHGMAGQYPAISDDPLFVQGSSREGQDRQAARPYGS